MTTAPLRWLKQVEDALSTLQQIPLWGSSPPFPWQESSLRLSELLQLPDLKLSLKATELRDPPQFLSGLGESPLHIPLSLTPIEGNLHWLMSQADVAKLTQFILSEQLEVKGFSSPQYQEGFYRYLILAVLQLLSEIRPFDDLNLTMASLEPLPDHPCVCIDISIKNPRVSLWGRILCPPAFMSAYRAHFSAESSSIRTSLLASKIDIPVRLELGHTLLSLEKWTHVKVGDLVILDRCTYDPETHKGTLTLVLDKTPLFRARLKEHHIKIIDYAYYHEEGNTMDEEENQDLDTSHNEEAESPLSDENHLWAGPQPSEEIPTETLPIHQIPLTITVEVTRLNMNLDKVLHLSVGNLIELPVRPEQGVNLMINGKRVAQGELVKIGDMLGVKIIHKGP